ncbi:hypothetical protein QBC40DRAFT_345822 [Triangularia verruculosa]|uniref:J domain-containing protein n=1 Tax=Triangularia verruculosa TaxID=2587418 RepID=A0AAN6XNN8_9PEZI|nr:hypothetical protein QBC40DRAFT_345822 [Triangularia verruculosa]
MKTRHPFNVKPAKPDYYFDLGFSTFNDEHTYIKARDIKNAWLKLVKHHHPDKKRPGEDGDAAEFRRVHEAYDCLRDEHSRALYDAEYPRIRFDWLCYRKLASEEQDAARHEIEASEVANARQEEATREAERLKELRDRWKRDETNRQWEFVAKCNRRNVEELAEEQARVVRERQARERLEDAARRLRELQEEVYRERLWRQDQEQQRQAWEEMRLKADRKIRELKARLLVEREEREFERARRDEERRREERERRQWQVWVEESERRIRQYEQSYRGAPEQFLGAQEMERESTQTDTGRSTPSVTAQQAPFYCRHPLTGWSVRFGRAECFFCGRVKGWLSWTRQCPKCDGRACLKCKAYYIADIMKRRYRRYRSGGHW